MKNSGTLSIVLLMSIFISTVSAQQSEVSVGDINISDLKWGSQRASFTVTNNGENFRWTTVVTEISFTGKYLSPHRFTRQHYSLEPEQTRTIQPRIIVPGNFGTANIRITLYDVIDTLDVLFDDSKLFERLFTLQFEAPEAVQPYLSERILLPPMVENGPVFDNEFSHILPFMLADGLSVAEIAGATNSDTTFVLEIMDDMFRLGNLAADSNGIRPTFPLLSLEEATEGKKLSDWLADTLAVLIRKNWSLYDTVIDSLIESGSMSADVQDFLSGGNLLHKRYPVVAALFLWTDLGQRFISATRRPLTIYMLTDPCKASIPRHMYMVRGETDLNGEHFYNLNLSGGAISIDFSDRIPKIDCPENLYSRKILRELRDWSYAKEFSPETFVFKQSISNVAVRSMEKELLEPLQYGLDRLKELASKYGHENLHEGYRYWFWNLTATRTVHLLVKSGDLKRLGNGHFKFVASRI